MKNKNELNSWLHKSKKSTNNTYAALDITFDWSTVNDDSGVVDAVYNSIKDLVHVWFKSYNVESHVEDDIAGGVLDNSLEIVL